MSSERNILWLYVLSFSAIVSAFLCPSFLLFLFFFLHCFYPFFFCTTPKRRSRGHYFSFSCCFFPLFSWVSFWFSTHCSPFFFVSVRRYSSSSLSLFQRIFSYIYIYIHTHFYFPELSTSFLSSRLEVFFFTSFFYRKEDATEERGSGAAGEHTSRHPTHTINDAMNFFRPIQ